MSAPGPQAWKELLGEQPLVIFLDELPPYLEYAVAVPVGNGNLATVTTAQKALTNCKFGRGPQQNWLYLTSSDMDRVTGYLYRARVPTGGLR